MNRTLYEFMPTLYIGAGALINLMFDNMLGRVSTTLLVLAGVVVFNMRINARAK